MALKAGYVGVKRWLYEKLQATTAKNVQDISNIRSEQALLGARNLNATDYAKAASLTNIVPTFNSDGSITVTGTTTAAESLAGGSAANFTAWYGGKVRISDAPANVTMALYDATAGSNAGTAGQTVTMIAGHAYRLSITFAANKTFTNVTVNPLIVIASDPTTEPSAYAMTNQQLTKRLVHNPIYTSVSGKGLTFRLDRKDDIVIITVAGEATEVIQNATKIADLPTGYEVSAYGTVYLTFLNLITGGTIGVLDIRSNAIYANTAIASGDKPRGSVTLPAGDAAALTRSLDREASPEVVEDPEPVTKTTRSTKKTATIKEGE